MNQLPLTVSPTWKNSKETCPVPHRESSIVPDHVPAMKRVKSKLPPPCRSSYRRSQPRVRARAVARRSRERGFMPRLQAHDAPVAASPTEGGSSALRGAPAGQELRDPLRMLPRVGRDLLVLGARREGEERLARLGELLRVQERDR